MRKSQAIKMNPNGYTFISMMIALTALSLITSIIANMAVAAFGNHQYDPLDRKDVWLFLTQIKNELASGEHYHTFTNGISFQLNDQIVNYTLFDTTIRRNVDGKGYEIVLQDVKRLSFIDQPKSISILLTDLKGRDYLWEIEKMVQ
ncbi:MAG: competence type IV pilus minor pilin ComGF [Tuberibacillus sp.]